MRLAVKICGLTDLAAVAATASAGVDYAGFVFYPKSSRYLTLDLGATLVAALPPAVLPVGLFVDAADDLIAATLDRVPVKLLQLHGQESVERVAAIKARFKLPVIKAVGVATAADIHLAQAMARVADLLLLDAAPTAGQAPGGNATAFDWALLQGLRLPVPWLLAGGLRAENLAAAYSITTAPGFDVSSGVEDGPGRKSPDKIKAFVAAVRQLETTS